MCSNINIAIPHIAIELNIHVLTMTCSPVRGWIKGTAQTVILPRLKLPVGYLDIPQAKPLMLGISRYTPTSKRQQKCSTGGKLLQ